MKLVLDVGAGEKPWTELSEKLPEERQTFFTDLTALAKQAKLYVRLDVRVANNKSGPFVLADAQRLPVRDGEADLVVFSDLLTVPDHDWCACESSCDCSCSGCDCAGHLGLGFKSDPGCCGRIERGFSQNTKEGAVEEALRVLQVGGWLFAGNYQTPAYSLTALEKLRKDGRLNLVKEDKQYWVNEFTGQLLGSCEILLEKKGL